MTLLPAFCFFGYHEITQGCAVYNVIGGLD